MIAKDSLILLECLFDTELKKFVTSQKTYGQLSKQSRIDECQEDIINFMESKDNSIFVIKNTTKDKKSTMSIIVSNIFEKNDHSKRYIITISESCETFKVERELTYIENENTTQVIIDFEKFRL